MQRTIELPEEQVRALEQLAAREHRSLDEMAQLAVGDYLVRRRNWADWGRRWKAVVADIRSGVPPDVTPEEIEADITAAFGEVRAERAARPSPPMRTVVDANIFVSAVLTPGGPPGQVVHGQFDAIISEPIIRDVADVLARPRITQVPHPRRTPVTS